MTDAPGEARPRRTVGGGATLASAAALGTTVAGGLLGILVARVLGPAETGDYNIASTTLLIGMVFFAFGVNTGATFLVSSGRWRPANALRQTQIAAAFTGTLGVAVGVAALTLGRDSLFAGVPTEVVLIALAGIPFALSWTHTAAVALASDRYEAFSLAPLTTNVAALGLTAVLTPTVGLTGSVTALAAAHALNAVWLLWRERRVDGLPEHGWLERSPAELRAALGFGFKTYVPQALQLLNYRADLFILNVYAASATVGHYAVALLVTEAGYLLPRALSAVVMPRVAALHAPDDVDHQRMVIVKSIRHAVALSLPIAAVLAIGVLTIPLVFGSAYSDSVPLGMILIPGVVAVGLANVYSAVFVGRGRPQYALYGALATTPVTLALYIVLIPRFGAEGAAFASTASYLVTAGIALFFFRRATGLRLAETLPRTEDLRDYRQLAARGVAYLRARRR